MSRRRDLSHHADSTVAAWETRAVVKAPPSAGPRGRLRHLPWPEEWGLKSRTEVVGRMAITALFGALGLSVGLRGPHGDAPQIEAYAISLFGGIALLVLVPVYRVAIRRRVRRTRGIRTASLGSHAQGMLLPYARGVTVLSLFAAGTGVLVGLAMLFVIAPSPDQGYREVAAAPFGVCIIAACLWWSTRLLRTGWRARGLLLNPDGVAFFGRDIRSFARWDEIADVSPSRGDGDILNHGIQVRLMGMAAGSDGSALVDYSSGPDRWLIQRVYLGIDPVLANQILTFYVENPDARAELGGPVGIARLKKADVPAYVQPSVVAAARQKQWLEENWGTA